MDDKYVSACENYISRKSENNPYLLFMIYKYFEMSGEDPANIATLGRVVKWIIYDYDAKGNKDIEDMKLRIKRRYNRL